VTAILVLGIGLCASLAIFSFVDAALLKPLPYRDPARPVGVYEHIPLCERCNLSFLDYLDWKRMNKTLSSLELYVGCCNVYRHGRKQILPLRHSELMQKSIKRRTHVQLAMKALRERQGWTQAILAQILGMGLPSLGRLEATESPTGLTLARLHGLAKAAGEPLLAEYSGGRWRRKRKRARRRQA
jgi:DNA-binding XRE family transcriptional regulator